MTTRDSFATLSLAGLPSMEAVRTAYDGADAKQGVMLVSKVLEALDGAVQLAEARLGLLVRRVEKLEQRETPRWFEEQLADLETSTKELARAHPAAIAVANKIAASVPLPGDVTLERAPLGRVRMSWRTDDAVYQLLIYISGLPWPAFRVLAQRRTSDAPESVAVAMCFNVFDLLEFISK